MFSMTLFSDEIVASELKSALEAVRGVYGPRDPSWGQIVEFWPGRTHINTSERRSEKIAIIRIREGRDFDCLKSDLLHECTHLLNPWLVEGETTNLEEAAAMAVALNEKFQGNPSFVSVNRKELAKDPEPQSRAYHAALTDLEGLAPDTFGLVKALRGDSGRSLSRDMEAKDIIKFVHGCDKAVARRLCEKFDDWIKKFTAKNP
jgi:hypothetical protein